MKACLCARAAKTIIKTVIEMQEPLEKLKSKLGLSKLSRKMLRLPRANAEFPVSSAGKEKFAHLVAPIIYHESQNEIRSALLNAECMKAEALISMERQKNRFSC